MTAFRAIGAAAADEGLAIVGWFHSEPEDLAPEGCRTLLLLGPGGPEMWAAFQDSTEFKDGEPHPMDRWSRRVISSLAEMFGVTALFPFGGPPYQPFQRWATRGEGARTSPVAMQVTPGRGLWASYRGALALPDTLDLPDRVETNPCNGCAEPCLSACPVEAFAAGRYDVVRCVAHVQSDAGTACRAGCLVRRACPAGFHLDLPAQQKTFHLEAFLRANG